MFWQDDVCNKPIARNSQSLCPRLVSTLDYTIDMQIQLDFLFHMLVSSRLIYFLCPSDVICSQGCYKKSQAWLHSKKFPVEIEYLSSCTLPATS